MKKVILFGATGNLGSAIAKELIEQGYELTIVVRNKITAKQITGKCSICVVTDLSKPENLVGILNNHEIVISSLGKSISLNDKSKTSFKDVNYSINANILAASLNAGIKKFIYISAFHSEQYQHLAYFKAHHDFAELLKKSGIDYSIIKPVALFSAFNDLIAMAKKRQLMNIGRGDKKTNPIYEGDLAKITVNAIDCVNATIEAGGKNIYTRKKLNEIIQQSVHKKQLIKSIPIVFFKAPLPLAKIFSKSTYHKLSFFLEVIQHDTIAPQLGEMSFEDYIQQKVFTHQ